MNKGRCLRKLFLTLLTLIVSLIISACGPKDEAGGDLNPDPAVPQKPTEPPVNSEDIIFSIYEDFKHTFIIINELGNVEVAPFSGITNSIQELIPKLKENCNIKIFSAPQYLDRLLIGRSFSIADMPKTDLCPFNYLQRIKISEIESTHRIMQNVSGTARLDPQGNLWDQFLTSFSLDTESSKETVWTSKVSGFSNIIESVSGILTQNKGPSALVHYNSKIKYWWDNNKTTYIDATLNYTIDMGNQKSIIQEIYSMNKEGLLTLKIFLDKTHIKSITYFPPVMYIQARNLQ